MNRIYFFSTDTPAKVESLIRRMQRNPFFMPSGFEEQEKINISEYKSDAKRMQDKIKERKRAERKLHKHAKHNGGVASLDAIIERERKLHKQAKIRDKCKHPKNYTKSFHIQCGFDLAVQWGWGGVSKPYNPKLMRAR